MRAEIIPYEPDAVSTAEGIVMKLFLFSLVATRIRRLSLFPTILYNIIDWCMKIYVNNKEQEVTEHIRVSDLAAVLQLPAQGIALAVNNRMIPRTEWENTELLPEANIVIIKAACGG